MATGLPPCFTTRSKAAISGAGGKRLSPCGSQQFDHRPLRRAGVPFARGIWRSCVRTILRRARKFRGRLCPRENRPANSCSALIRISDGRSRPAPWRCFPDGDARSGAGGWDTRRGSSTRNLVTGKIEAHAGDAVVLATGGYVECFLPFDQCPRLQTSPRPIAPIERRALRQPCFTQIHPTCIPVSGANQSKLTLMSESLRNDGRVWFRKRKGDKRPPKEIPELNAIIISSENIELRKSRPARHLFPGREKRSAMKGAAVGRKAGVAFTSISRMQSLAWRTRSERYGNLFHIYEKITGEDAYDEPMGLSGGPLHDGGLLVGIQLMQQHPGVARHRRSEFSDHGANGSAPQRALQGSGPMVLRPALHAAGLSSGPDRQTAGDRSLGIPKGGRGRSVRAPTGCSEQGQAFGGFIPSRAGSYPWDNAGWRKWRGLREALAWIPEMREQFWREVRVPGDGEEFNQSLERAGRIADFWSSRS